MIYFLHRKTKKPQASAQTGITTTTKHATVRETGVSRHHEAQLRDPETPRILLQILNRAPIMRRGVRPSRQERLERRRIKQNNSVQKKIANTGPSTFADLHKHSTLSASKYL